MNKQSEQYGACTECIFMHSVTIMDAYLKGGDKCNVWKKQKGACSFSEKGLY